jgi:hypothetical protein
MCAAGLRHQSINHQTFNGKCGAYDSGSMSDIRILRAQYGERINVMSQGSRVIRDVGCLTNDEHDSNPSRGIFPGQVHDMLWSPVL